MDMTAASALQVLPLPGLPNVEPGDDVAALLVEALGRAGIKLQSGDVVAVAQKIISKAEDRYVFLKSVTPSPRAEEIAKATRKDPRIVELVLRESSEVLRMKRNVLIVRHKHGYVLAQAGIDQSNIISDPDNPRVLLLPEDPDTSAQKLRDALGKRCGVTPYVLITDSWGRAWRRGIVGFALGAAGFAPIVSKIGAKDMMGRTMEVTEIAIADQLASMATHVMGEAAEGTPAVVIRGARVSPAHSNAAALIRPLAEDLFQ
jgi:coenzyme F420-0:L-glutamate ligase/coenzyme F420-1:gamma-L-glutamate ligase